ncbi:MAG: omptin family outer membrane protease [Spirochaetaceae bacterium]|jgi:outer membrane protease|nr:omptin family outer membrane protease [Spirochaetaceae bacterium]
MRNIPFFWVLVIVSAGFLAAPPAVQKVYSQDKPRLVSSATFRTGFLYGKSQEVVYAAYDSSRFLSELLWDHTPLFYLGAEASFSRARLFKSVGLFANLAFNAGVPLPLSSGIMEDRDWEGTDNALDKYSAHESFSRIALFGDADLGLSIPLRFQDEDMAFLKIYANFSYMYFTWDAYNGYTQYLLNNPNYTVWDSSMPKTMFRGQAVSYQQQWFLFSPGIGVDFPIGSLWSIGISFQISPVIWTFAVDDHVNRNKQFEDILFGGIFMEPGLDVVFSPNKRFAFSGGVSYRFIEGTRGASREREMLNGEPDGDFSIWSGNSAGAGYKALNTRLGMQVFF